VNNITETKSDQNCKRWETIRWKNWCCVYLCELCFCSCQL